MQCFVFKTVEKRCRSYNKKKRTSTEDKFKVLKDMENDQSKSLVAETYGVPRNTIST